MLPPNISKELCTWKPTAISPKVHIQTCGFYWKASCGSGKTNKKIWSPFTLPLLPLHHLVSRLLNYQSCKEWITSKIFLNSRTAFHVGSSAKCSSTGTSHHVHSLDCLLVAKSTIICKMLPSSLMCCDAELSQLRVYVSQLFISVLKQSNQFLWGKFKFVLQF